MKTRDEITKDYGTEPVENIDWVLSNEALRSMLIDAQLEVLQEIEDNIGYYAEKHGEGADADREHFKELRKTIMNDGK